MKKLLIATLLISTSAQAQTMPSDAQMKKAMQQMEALHKKGNQMPNPKMIQAMQGLGKCMQTELGDAGMKRMQEAGQAHQKEFNALCKAGKDDEALELQKKFAYTMMESDDYKAMKGCSDKYKDALKSPHSQDMLAHIRSVESKKDKGICG